MIINDENYDDLTWDVEHFWEDILLDYGESYKEKDLKDTIIDILKGL